MQAPESRSPASGRTAVPAAGPPALRIAIVGAESTGKSELVQALARRLPDDFGLRCTCVGEYLREWCDQRGRTPRADEQLAIAREQQRRIEAAAAQPDIDVVLCDTTPIMIAVYSELLFDDLSFDAFAAECQRSVDATLLTALDLPWIADGLQRDGPHVRAPVDALVRSRLVRWGVDFSLVLGTGDARAENAMQALRPLLRGRAEQASADAGLFGRLLASRGGPPGPAWVCERCDQPECEHVAVKGSGA
jgi:nicotinamide riboside kinase